MQDSTARPAGLAQELGPRLEQHRVSLTGYCYRMLGSAFDAEDAVQDTFVKAWQGYERFEGRASLRTWLHRIATNVCLDMLDGRARRERPMARGSAGSPDGFDFATRPDATWLQPIPDSRALPGGDPAALLASRETTRLAFVAALQRLPPRQRAVLILREVLSWHATEVAELLGTTVASVNSALQRARATLAATPAPATDTYAPLAEEQQTLLGRYVDAFERYDMDSLTSLLHEEATLSMPPYALWLRGPPAICAWHLGTGAGCRGSRLVPTVASGTPAFGQYRPSASGGGHEPWALQVLEISGGRIVGLNAFLDTARLFPLCGLPPRLGA
ncbi:MAG: sigma-70 family RNA polymerase sigma factor [Pseudomonadota bacterium]|nr:sigma-70 family RNA polymerase sigma factor [Pseudomonadota bacterium]